MVRNESLPHRESFSPPQRGEGPRSGDEGSCSSSREGPSSAFGTFSPCAGRRTLDGEGARSRYFADGFLGAKRFDLNVSAGILAGRGDGFQPALLGKRPPEKKWRRREAKRVFHALMTRENLPGPRRDRLRKRREREGLAPRSLKSLADGEVELLTPCDGSSKRHRRCFDDSSTRTPPSF